MSAIAAATPAAFVEEPSRDGTPVVIRVSGLRKSYGSVEAVAGIDFDVRAGEIFAFVGPNGAGKTTTVEMLEGYRHRSGGEVEVLGVDPQAPTRAWRSRIGVVLQSCQLPPLLSVRELVSRFATYYPTPRGVVVMPMVELFILVSSFGNETIRVPGQPSTFKESTYLVAPIRGPVPPVSPTRAGRFA